MYDLEVIWLKAKRPFHQAAVGVFLTCWSKLGAYKPLTKRTFVPWDSFSFFNWRTLPSNTFLLWYRIFLLQHLTCGLCRLLIKLHCLSTVTKHPRFFGSMHLTARQHPCSRQSVLEQNKSHLSKSSRNNETSHEKKKLLFLKFCDCISATGVITFEKLMFHVADGTLFLFHFLSYFFSSIIS